MVVHPILPHLFLKFLIPIISTFYESRPLKLFESYSLPLVYGGASRKYCPPSLSHSLDG